MDTKALLALALCLHTVNANAQTSVTDTVRLVFETDTVSLGEVVVTKRRTPEANGRWSDMQPVELVTVAGANGDLYKSLQTMPGTQLQGETGQLLVRGGDAEETQTYIDGLHVMKPYTTASQNSAVRSRYSTFMFSGVNLASGGAPLEYGQAMSAVLPLETKDESNVTKVGANASIVGIGAGGTRAFSNGSVSVDLNYQDLRLYNSLFDSRTRFESPYRMFSAAAQLRHTPKKGTVVKLYGQYDRTDFTTIEGDDDMRLFGLAEDNVYVNATMRHATASGWRLYGGAALSFNSQRIAGAVQTGDKWRAVEGELHVKATASRFVSPTVRIAMGAESYVRRYENSYAALGGTRQTEVNPTVSAAFASADWHPVYGLKTEFGARFEHASTDGRLSVSPRVAMTYTAGKTVVTATVGRYTQLAATEYLAVGDALRSSSCVQCNAGVQYGGNGRMAKAEAYYKDYRRLPLYEGGTLSSNGRGHSRGIDLFVIDRATVRNVECRLSYTYNVSRRRYLEYSEMTTPQYATRHNAALVVRWTLPRLRTIIGLTDVFTSGRPFHNPERAGLMNDETKPYNSLDLGLTLLPSPKVIIHASATNILGRRNVFGREDGNPVLASNDHFFYIGVFVTLGKKAAYDVSNF